jgi:uncharacterized membrane protein
MPQSSLVTWVGSAVALLLVALCAATAYATLRGPMRTRIVHWPATRLLGVCVLAALPWLYVWLRVKQVSVSVNGVGPFIGWLILGLLAFALLILLPLAAMLALLVWSAARVRR